MARRRTSARAFLSVLFWMAALTGACESDEKNSDAFESDLPAAGFFHGSQDAGNDADANHQSEHSEQ